MSCCRPTTYDYVKARLDATIYNLDECRKRLEWVQQAALPNINEELLEKILEEQMDVVSRDTMAVLNTLREAQ